MNSENSRNFAHFRQQLEMLLVDTDKSAKRVVSRMADVGLKETKRNTPVGQYKDGRQGGTLQKGWKKTPTHKTGNAFLSGYDNNTNYGLFVNNGHRIVDKDGKTIGYVKGKRMLEQGMNEARRQTETLFRQEIARVKRETGF